MNIKRYAQNQSKLNNFEHEMIMFLFKEYISQFFTDFLQLYKTDYDLR